MTGLEGKVALITGAASGIGAATAEAFAAAGTSLVLADIDVGGIERLAAVMPRAKALRCDVSARADIDAAIAAAEAHFGGLDILVNNAAIQDATPLLETPDDLWRRVIDVNLTSVFLATRAAGEAMARRGGGAIVNVSSTFALVGSPGYAAYHAAKGGVSSFTRAAAIGLRPLGIRVNAVCPGTTDTPGLRAGAEATADPAAALAGYLALQPFGRFGTAAEIAAAILFLASDAASFVTGAELVVDGGYTIV